MSTKILFSLILLGSTWGSLAQAASQISGPTTDPVIIVQDDDDEEKKKKKRGS